VRQQAQRGQVTQYQYDALNELVKTIDPLAGQTNLTYDGNGNLSVGLHRPQEPSGTVLSCPV
jgi:YD repeat-containing protein